MLYSGGWNYRNAFSWPDFRMSWIPNVKSLSR